MRLREAIFSPLFSRAELYGSVIAFAATNGMSPSDRFLSTTAILFALIIVTDLFKDHP